MSYANANNDASNSNANVGSRLDNQPSAYITEGGKERRIQILTMIACHAIMAVVDAHLKRRFIRTFDTLPELEAFYTAYSAHIQDTQQEGWTAKDNLDLDLYRAD